DVDGDRRSSLVPPLIPDDDGRPPRPDVGVYVACGGRDLIDGARPVAEVESVRDDPPAAVVVTDAARRIEVHGLTDDRRGIVDGQGGGRPAGDRGGDREDLERDGPHEERDARLLSER